MTEKTRFTLIALLSAAVGTSFAESGQYPPPPGSYEFDRATPGPGIMLPTAPRYQDGMQFGEAQMPYGPGPAMPATEPFTQAMPPSPPAYGGQPVYPPQGGDQGFGYIIAKPGYVIEDYGPYVILRPENPTPSFGGYPEAGMPLPGNAPFQQFNPGFPHQQYPSPYPAAPGYPGQYDDNTVFRPPALPGTPQ